MFGHCLTIFDMFGLFSTILDFFGHFLSYKIGHCPEMSTGRGFMSSLKAPGRGLKRLDFSGIFPVRWKLSVYQSGKIQNQSGKIILISRKDNYQSGVSEYFPEKIENSTGKINSATGKITIPPN